MLASIPSCPSLCGGFSTGMSRSWFIVFVILVSTSVPRVPEKYKVTSAQSSVHAGKVNYNRVHWFPEEIVIYFSTLVPSSPRYDAFPPWLG